MFKHMKGLPLFKGQQTTRNAHLQAHQRVPAYIFTVSDALKGLIFRITDSYIPGTKTSNRLDQNSSREG